jgi:hypothetical protein
VGGMGERDRTIDRLLRQSRQDLPFLRERQDAGVTEACLDAETLAAWVEGGLSGAALEMAQSHVADCPRCLELAGALGRIDSVASTPEPGRAATRWLAWLVPLTAVAAAAALWVVIPQDGRAPMAPTDDVRRQAADMTAEAPQQPEAGRQAFANTTQEPSAPAAAPVSPGAPVETDERPSQTAVASGALNDGLATDPQAKAEAKELAKDAAQPEAARVDGLRGASGAVTSSAAPLASVPDKAAAPARLAERAAEAALAVEIVSPDPAVRWRVAGSLVQRSTDGGARWEDLSTGVAAEFTAGAAPSSSVCWLVGRGGVVLLSTDGRLWRRTAFPEMTDLSAIRARDAQAASVSTIDGRSFSTTDGGATWVPRPLQEF